MELKTAKREKIKVPIMLMGASGSGKTLSALLIAKGIVERMLPELSNEEQWQKIALIDSEHNRALLYAQSEHDGVKIDGFQHLDLEAPYTADRYMKAFTVCKNAGCEVIIVDSLSHAWSGEGGILEKVESFGGRYQDWKEVKPDEKLMLKMLIDSDLHVIATTRSKQATNVTTNEVGKLQVEKIGLKPDQKDSLDYEFAITFQMYQDHTAEATKDNSSMFDRRLTINREVGQNIYDWAEKGIDVKAQEKAEKVELIKDINALAAESEAKQNELNKLLFKVNNAPLEQLENPLLKRMKFLLEQVIESTEKEITNQTN